MKRGRVSDDVIVQSFKTRSNYNLEYTLTDMMQARVNNDRFLLELVENTLLIGDILNSTEGFYGTLNQSNRFWYLVVFKLSEGRVHAWDPRFNYKIPARQMLRKSWTVM